MIRTRIVHKPGELVRQLPNRRLTHRLVSSLVIMAAFLFAGPQAAIAAEKAPSPEYQLKASYIYHFTKFIQWPDDKLEAGDGTLAICVLGTDPFGKALDAISGKKSHGARIGIFRIEPTDQRECHIVFITEPDPEREAELIKAFRQPGILVVGESDEFIGRGGIMRFMTLKDRVRFQIDEAAAESAGLEIPKKLMSVAVPLD